MKKLTFTVLFALMAIVSAQAAKVYLKIGEGRVTAESDIAVWVWNDGGTLCANKAWPGDKLTEKETIGTTDYFVYTVNTEGSYALLFNNNQSSGTKQTKDIEGITGDCTFVLNNEWDGEKWSYTKTEGAPSAETPVETYTVKLGGNAYGAWSTLVTFTYNAETKEYVYEETEPAKLADDFKIDIPETKKWFKRDDLVNKNLSEASSDFVAMNDNSGDMKIADAADYAKITLTVKKEGETWKMKIVGEKKETRVETYAVQLRGVKYSWNDDAPAFTYDEVTGEYVYEETETAKLANEFKVTVNNTYYKAEEFVGKALDNSLDFVAMNDIHGNMNITDAADYSKITLTVKNDNGTWKLKVVGVKTDKVQITGKFNGWAVADMKLDNNTYSIEIEEGIEDLTNGDGSTTTDYGFCILINGVHYGGKKTITLGGDAVTMDANPGDGNNLKIDDTADFKVVHLFVKKVDDNWTISAKGSHTSSVAGVDAAGVVIAAANGEIVVDGAQSVAVYTTAGALVSTDARTRVAAGLYIVRADNVVKKVIVK